MVSMAEPLVQRIKFDVIWSCNEPYRRTFPCSGNTGCPRGKLSWNCRLRDRAVVALHWNNSDEASFEYELLFPGADTYKTLSRAHLKIAAWTLPLARIILQFVISIFADLD